MLRISLGSEVHRHAIVGMADAGCNARGLSGCNTYTYRTYRVVRSLGTSDWSVSYTRIVYRTVRYRLTVSYGTCVASNYSVYTVCVTRSFYVSYGVCVRGWVHGCVGMRVGEQILH